MVVIHDLINTDYHQGHNYRPTSETVRAYTKSIINKFRMLIVIFLNPNLDIT